MDRTLRHGDPAEAGMAPERVARVRRGCAEWVEQGLTPALQVLVARRGVIVLHEAWGRLGPEDDAPPLTVDAIFGIASVTKPITATAVLCLVEDGLLGLNRPVQEYVPEFAGEGKAAVMVHHLLTHTSGLRTDDLDAHALAKVRGGMIAPPEPLPYTQPEDFLHLRCFDAVHDASLRTAPGAEMSYCNYNYQLLAEIVTRVAGQPVDRFTQGRIFDPLEMASTSYVGVPPERRERIVGRAADAPFAVLNEPDVMALCPGGASAYATARDLAVFGQMFLNGGAYGRVRVLSPAAVREMTRNQIPGIGAHWAGESFPEASWGLGWSVQGNKKATRDASLLSPSTFTHGGAGGSYLWVDPQRELVGVYLSVMPSAAGDPRFRGLVDLFANAVMAAIVE